MGVRASPMEPQMCMKLAVLEQDSRSVLSGNLISDQWNPATEHTLLSSFFAVSPASNPPRCLRCTLDLGFSSSVSRNLVSCLSIFSTSSIDAVSSRSCRDRPLLSSVSRFPSRLPSPSARASLWSFACSFAVLLVEGESCGCLGGWSPCFGRINS